MIKVKKFPFNPVGVNAYLLWDETLEAVLIDPACFFGYEEIELSRFVASEKLKIVHLLNTHGHFDHLMGNLFAGREWKLTCRIHLGDLAMVDQASQHAKAFGITMSDPPSAIPFLWGEVITFGLSELKLIHVPGHSPGSVAFYGERDGILVVGDILFEGSVGRTDLPGGNHEQLISGIKEKLLTLGDNVKVYPGHGSETTTGRERKTNPFLQ